MMRIRGSLRFGYEWDSETSTKRGIVQGLIKLER
jgi:hypothetical protein